MIDTDANAPEVRCPNCRHLLLRGRLIGETRCPRCKALVRGVVVYTCEKVNKG